MKHLLCDLSGVEFIDSTGISELIRLNKASKKGAHSFILMAPSKTVRAALKLMKLTDFFLISPTVGAAIDLAEAASKGTSPHVQFGRDGNLIRIKYHGEITIENCDRLWRRTVTFLPCGDSKEAKVIIDLADVKFIDASGIKWLLRVKNRVEERGGRFTLSDVGESVSNVIKQTKTTDSLLGHSL